MRNAAYRQRGTTAIQPEPAVCGRGRKKIVHATCRCISGRFAWADCCIHPSVFCGWQSVTAIVSLAAGWQVLCGCQLARGLCWKGAARGVVSRAFWRSTSPPTNPPTNSHFLRFGNGSSWACKSKNPAKSWVFASIRNAKGSLKELRNRRFQVRPLTGAMLKTQ